MIYEAIIDKYYPEEEDGAQQPSALRRLLLKHSRQVADHCLRIADRHPELQLDKTFIEAAAMLHDIGIRWCHAPSILCNGTEPYIRHGLIGAELLRSIGCDEAFARICERHTGTGLTRQQIERQQLPLPLQDFVPVTLAEQVVCYADLFHSKSNPDRVPTVAQVAQGLEKFGHEGVETFLGWAERFE